MGTLDRQDHLGPWVLWGHLGRMAQMERMETRETREMQVVTDDGLLFVSFYCKLELLI